MHYTTTYYVWKTKQFLLDSMSWEFSHWPADIVISLTSRWSYLIGQQMELSHWPAVVRVPAIEIFRQGNPSNIFSIAVGVISISYVNISIIPIGNITISIIPIYRRGISSPFKKRRTISIVGEGREVVIHVLSLKLMQNCFLNINIRLLGHLWAWNLLLTLDLWGCHKEIFLR